MSTRCPYPDCDPGSHAADDSDILGDAIANAVTCAISDAEFDAWDESVTLDDYLADLIPQSGPLRVPCADPECGFIAYH